MTVRFQGLRVRISPVTRLSVVSLVRYVGRDLFLGPFPHAEDLYRVWFFWVWSLDNLEVQGLGTVSPWKKKSARKSLIQNTDNRLALSFVGMLLVTSKSVCSMMLDKTFTSKYLRHTEEAERLATKSRPNSSETFTKAGNSVTEKRGIEHWNSRTSEIYFYLCMSHIALSESVCRVSSCRVPPRIMNYDVTVNGDLHSSRFCITVHVNGLRKSRKMFTVRSVVLTEIRNFCLPKICKKHYQIWEDNIKKVEGTKPA